MSSNSSKRVKVDSEEEYEISKNNVMSSKERARKHRQRKKQYYKDLEEENKQLKAEVEKLKCRIVKLEEENKSAAKGSPNGFDSEFKPTLTSLRSGGGGDDSSNINEHEEKENEEEEFNPDSDILRDHLPGFKQDRVPMMRDSFKKIIDNVLTIEGQCALVIFDHVSISKWLKIVNSSRKKFMERKEKGNIIMSKILETKVSQSLINFVKEHGREYTKVLQDLRKTVRKLVYVRNKIFYLKNRIKDIEVKANFSNSFPLSIEDQRKILKVMNDLKTNKILDYSSLWHIPQRDKEKEYGSDIELSE